MSNRSVEIYLRDILESIQAIESYLNNKSYDDFVSDRMFFSATVREFEIIGEAVGKLPDVLKIRYSDVGWRNIKDFRNLLIHEYFGIDTEIVWDAIQNEIPILKKVVYEILKHQKLIEEFSV